jgi:broad specificity phosphatase PhoE
MRLLLFRHGAVARRDIYFGQFDNPLSPEGEAHSDAIAEALVGVDFAASYTSDLGRAMDAGRRIQRRMGMPFTPDARLRELHLGWADGLVRTEVELRDASLKERSYASLTGAPFTEGGETVHDLAARVRPFIREIADRHRGRKVVVVAHNTVNRVLLGDALGLPMEGVFSFRQDFGCLNIIEFGETRARVALLNADPSRYRL